MSRRHARGICAVLRTALGALVLMLVASAACGRNPMGFAGDGADGGESSSGDDDDGGSAPLFPPGDGGGAPLKGALTIAPLAPVITVMTNTPAPTVPFTAKVGVAAATVVWILDRGELGTLDKNGLFTPSGNVAGTGNVVATYGGVSAKTTITVNVQRTDLGDPIYSPTPAPPGPGGYGGVGGDGPAGPASPGQVTTLTGAPTTDTSVTLLYPYDGTVWPQALLAPLLQWTPGSHSFDSVYVHIQEKSFEYKGYFAANKSPFVNVPIPQKAWATMGFSNSGEPVTISLIFGEGAKAYGPYTETWRIAQGSLQGTIYYNSYGTSLVKNSGSDALDHYGNQYGAGTLAIAPGATAPKLVAGVNSVNPSGDGTGCRVCHTASADGTALVTQGSDSSASSYDSTFFVNLANDTTAGNGTPTLKTGLAFPALYRDGSLLFSSGSTSGMVPGDTLSELYSLPAGTPVAGVTGLPSGLQAGLPAFSPDGKHVSFNFWGGTFPGGASADRTSLGLLDFDGAKTFTNARVAYTPNAGGPSVTYSSFLPSSAAVVFEIELTNPTDEWAYTWQQHTAELWWLDVPSGAAHRLDGLNGYTPSGAVYLPNNAKGAATHSSAQDATVNYEPTVTPIASGGYAWIVFTSRRMYGNVAQLGPWVSNPTDYPWLDDGQITDKKLWVGAIDLGAAPGTDPSHPAFYLPGQELRAGNSRGYWTVPPCRSDGSSCDVGDECCGGFCETGTDGGLVCTNKTPTCSALYEKCTTTSNCCGATQGVECIDQVCTTASPPK